MNRGGSATDEVSGFLTGAYKSRDDFAKDDWRRTLPRFQGEAFQEVLTSHQGLGRRWGLTMFGRTSS